MLRSPIKAQLKKKKKKKKKGSVPPEKTSRGFGFLNQPIRKLGIAKCELCAILFFGGNYKLLLELSESNGPWETFIARDPLWSEVKLKQL